jgi:protein-glutamine gamma-glutamyltransferase
MNRVALIGLLGATAVAGLLFAPVFGLSALLAPVLAVVVACYLGVELTLRWPKLAPARPALVTVLGLLAVVEAVLLPTTVAGLPTGETLRALWQGVTESWLVTLQSTWPARPDPEQLLFVPLATLLVSVVGIELSHGRTRPLLALLPSLLLAGLSQAYQAFDGMAAVLAAAAYGTPAAVLLWACTRRDTGQLRKSVMDAWPVALTVVAVAAGAIAVGGIDPLDRGAHSLKDGRLAPLRETRTTSPLQQIANRLSTPDKEVFRYRADEPVPLWRLAVLDGFDGAGWTADIRPSRLGSRINEPPGTTTVSAEVEPGSLAGPWLPSQAIPVDVDGLAPLVDENTGVLLTDADLDDYRLTWAEPAVEAATLGSAPVDTRVHGGLGGVGVVPEEIDQLARDAVAELRPTFQSALQLDRFLRENYRVAVGEDLPTGHGWPQLRRFLLETKRGTSEQFAAAYVVLARMNGIPARLAVGFRGGAESEGGDHVVRNRDVLAWPEVAVRGVGWIPLDPTESAESAGTAAPRTGLAAAVDQARQQLPPERELRQPELPDGEQSAADAGQDSTTSPDWLLLAAIAVAALLLAWLLGVPIAIELRASRRRRRTGAAGVLGAWDEVCDRLRGHGVAYRAGMTPRDLATDVADPATSDVIRELGRVVDMVLWSGVDAGDGHARQAWRHVAQVRRGLAARPLSTRLRAAIDPRVLFRPRGRARHNPQRAPRTGTGSLV